MEENEEKPKKSNWKNLIWIMLAILTILITVFVIVFVKPEIEETNILEDVKHICDDNKCPVQEIGTDVNIVVEGDTSASAPVIINVT